jgi:hypothetical protein
MFPQDPALQSAGGQSRNPTLGEGIAEEGESDVPVRVMLVDDN